MRLKTAKLDWFGYYADWLVKTWV